MSKKRLFSLLKRGMAVTLAMSLVTGLAPVGIGPGRSSVKKAEAAGTSSIMGSDNYVAQANIKEGESYSFGGYDWIAAEDNGDYIILQSKGVTSGVWPGYIMWDGLWGDSDINGRNISSYDEKTQKLYNDIKYADYSSSGLYLVSNSKCNQTSDGEQGSGYYWQALKEAAANRSSFGADYYGAWLGIVRSCYAWTVYSSGNVGYRNNYQHDSYVVAPAFNLDKSKVTVNGNNIVPFFASTGIKATKSSIQSIEEGESIALSSVIGGVTYTGGTAAGNNASYTVSCDKGTISGTTYTAPRDVAINDSTVTFTIKSTRTSGWTSSVQVNIAQKYVNVSYNVTTNGGTSTAPSSVRDIDIDTVFDAASGVFDKTAEKQGWTFIGWNTDKDAHTALTSLTMDSDKTLYAIFKKDINTSFTDFNGTEKRVRNDSASMWNSATMAAVTLPEQGTKDGWTSAGWSVKSEPDPSQIITTPSYNISDSTDFYGIYKKTVSVNIDTDGDGVNDSTKDTDVYVNGSDQDAQQGTIQAPSSSPSKEGYDFDGWTEKDGDGTVYPPGTDMTVTGKGDIVPHYTPITYKVHFNINNGTSGTMEDQTLTYDEAASLSLNAFERTGYTFMGWSDTADGDVKYTDGKSIKNLSSVKNDTVNLYAVWKINSSGLTVAPAGGTWKHNGNAYTAPESFKQDYNTTLSIEEPERTGYTFKEWIKSYDTSKASGFNGKFDGNVYTFGEKDSAADTITASWTANKYTVEYYDGSTKAGGDTFTYDVSAPLKTFLSLGISKTGYDLKGWSESPSGDVKYTDGESIKNLSTVNNAVIKLYAVYEPHKYKITYNGVVGATNSNKTEYTVEDADFKLTEPVKEGFVFLGWTGEGITSPSKDVSIKTSEHKDLEYTAEWKSLISVSVPAKVQVRMSGGTTENASPVEFVNSSKSDVKVMVSSFAQTAAGDYTLIDRTADEKADWKKLSHKDRTMALYVENTKDSGFKTSGTKVYVNDSNRELGVISSGKKASPYITCHHTSSITDEETTLSMGSYTIQWTVALSQ